MPKVPVDPPVKNHLLAALPRKEYQRLLAELEPVSLGVKEVLHEPYQPIQHVYFPESGLITKVVSTEDGASVEVGVAGRDGMTGLCVFMGSSTAPFKVLVQIPGEANRMKAAAFLAAARRNGSLAEVLLRYAQAVLCMVSQSAACNLLHTVEKRLCRWLLMVHDRMDSDEFPITHESLALMLGVHRQSITEVARNLASAGLIRYRWGQLTILNRRGLEARACGCYRLIQQHCRLGKWS